MADCRFFPACQNEFATPSHAEFWDGYSEYGIGDGKICPTELIPRVKSFVIFAKSFMNKVSPVWSDKSIPPNYAIYFIGQVGCSMLE